jgi:mutator protein MutT
MDIALAIIKHPKDGTILIARRKTDTHLANFWEFPGGKCLPGESLQEAVIRETLEEVGIPIDIVDAWPMIEHAYPGRKVKLYPFVCRALKTDARPIGNSEIAWVASDDLAQYEFPEANAEIVRRLLGRVI